MLIPKTDMLPDSVTTTIVTQVHTTFVQGVQEAFAPMAWFMMFLGWVMYWLKTLNSFRNANEGKSYLKLFFSDNLVEIPISALSCLVIALLAKSISTDFIDLHGLLSVFMVGMGSSTILNSIITQAKKSLKSS